MSDNIVPTATAGGWASSTASWLSNFARRQVLARLDDLAHGQLIVSEGDQVYQFGKPGSQPAARIEVADAGFWPAAAFGGSLGVGESYILGQWRSPDIPALIRLFLENEEALRAVDSGLAWLTRPMHQLYHLARRNSRSGSRKNIVAHYDLGNDLFSLFLDPSMTYSSAYYARPEMDLHDAQLAKIDRLCERLGLRPGMHLLEIGTGWGAFAKRAAEHYGCQVTTTTISDEQYRHAVALIRDAGLQDRVTVLKSDYRDLTGQYDRIVSVEMIEAVGHQYYDEYFATCSRLLRDDGLIALQAITIRDREFERAAREVDFIKRYIFPGCCIPSAQALNAAASNAGDLQFRLLDDLTPHYARTLRDWRERFMERVHDVRQLGFPETFVRMWEFYLAYCEGGFATHYINLVHLVYAKPRHRLPDYGPAFPLADGQG